MPVVPTVPQSGWCLRTAYWGHMSRRYRAISIKQRTNRWANREQQALRVTRGGRGNWLQPGFQPINSQGAGLQEGWAAGRRWRPTCRLTYNSRPLFHSLRVTLPQDLKTPHTPPLVHQSARISSNRWLFSQTSLTEGKFVLPGGNGRKLAF